MKIRLDDDEKIDIDEIDGEVCSTEPTFNHTTFSEFTFSESLKENKIIINDLIDKDCVEKVVMQIIKYNEYDDYGEANIKDYKRFPIRMFINSPGGDITEMLSVISAMDTSKSPIYTYALGQVFSAAATIFIAGHVRYTQKFSSFMVHQPQLGYEGDLCSMTNYLSYVKSVNAKINKYMSSRTSITEKMFKKIFSERKDFYFDADFALRYKIAHEIF